jgi:hypothetical protein
VRRWLSLEVWTIEAPEKMVCGGGRDRSSPDRHTRRWVMANNPTTPDPHGRSGQPALPAILMATVDTLPEPYQVLGLVDAVLTGPPSMVPTSRLMDMLAAEAVAMRADGVIGIRLTQVALPIASQTAPLGRVTEHHVNSVVTTALGTAIRLESWAEGDIYTDGDLDEFAGGPGDSWPVS